MHSDYTNPERRSALSHRRLSLVEEAPGRAAFPVPSAHSKLHVFIPEPESALKVFPGGGGFII